MAGRILEHAYVCFGANSGDRELALARARDLLQSGGDVILRESTLFETEPWGGVEGGLFLNIVWEVSRRSSPTEFFHRMQMVETTLGRARMQSNAARKCDLDLLLWGNDIVHTRELTVPHPRMHLRRFVLAPLSDLIADKLHPQLHLTFADLLVSCKDDRHVRPLSATASQ